MPEINKKKFSENPRSRLTQVSESVLIISFDNKNYVIPPEEKEKILKIINKTRSEKK